jgi:hypothetical protein
MKFSMQFNEKKDIEQKGMKPKVKTPAEKSKVLEKEAVKQFVNEGNPSTEIPLK